MQRRRFIAISSGAVFGAGCVGQGSQSADSTATDTDTPTPTPRAGPRQVCVTSVSNVPDRSPLSHSVEVPKPTVNADQTARIAVEITNTADQTVWNAARIPAFSAFVTRNGPDGQRLLLLQPDEQYETVRSGCWRADLSKPQINHAYTNVVGDRRYEPGQTRTTQFDLYGHPDNTGPCLGPGEYPIHSPYSIGDSKEQEDAEWAYEWGFTITVEDS